MPMTTHAMQLSHFLHWYAQTLVALATVSTIACCHQLMVGRRNIITIITESEKDPRAMGFSLVDEPDEVFSVEVDADHDIEGMDAEPPIEGRDVPEVKL